MLVLTRKENEAVHMSLATGERLTVKVLRLRSGRVAIGFVAPPHVEIVRDELLPQADEKSGVAVGP